MKTFPLVLSLIALNLLLPSLVARADQPLTVTLFSGRMFTGEVDQRTDDERLWLRFGSQSATLLRPIRWERITGGVFEDRELDGPQVREIADVLASAGGDEAPTAQHGTSQSWLTVQSHGPSFAERAQAALGSRPRVATVRFDAWLENWDGDAEADGLMIRVYPLGDDGRLVPVDANLTAYLVALERRQFEAAPRSRGVTAERIGRWSRPVTADEIGSDGALLKLPFQSLNPETARQLAPSGTVHVRLVVPGHGVYEHQLEGVRLRAAW